MSLTDKRKQEIMDAYLQKLKEENLEKEEAIKLREMLEEKKKEAFNIGDFALAMGVSFLIAGLIGYIFERK